MLQDFLRPHWSNLPQDKLNGVEARLSWLSSQPELNTTTIARFYRDLASVLNARISLTPSVGTDEAEDENG